MPSETGRLSVCCQQEQTLTRSDGRLQWKGVIAAIPSADPARVPAPVPTADTPAPVLVLVHAGVAGIVVLLHRT